MSHWHFILSPSPRFAIALCRFGCRYRNLFYRRISEWFSFYSCCCGIHTHTHRHIHIHIPLHTDTHTAHHVHKFICDFVIPFLVINFATVSVSQGFPCPLYTPSLTLTHSLSLSHSSIAKIAQLWLQSERLQSACVCVCVFGLRVRLFDKCKLFPS